MKRSTMSIDTDVLSARPPPAVRGAIAFTTDMADTFCDSRCGPTVRRSFPTLRFTMLVTLFSVAVLHWVILLTPGANVLVVSQLAAGGERRAAAADAARYTGISAAAAFRLGFLTNILNPKSALFFGSVFVTALPHDAHAGLLVAALAIVLANALVWHLFLALAFSHPRIQLAYARKRDALTRLASASIGAFGLRLVMSAVADLRTKLGGGASASQQIDLWSKFAFRIRA